MKASDIPSKFQIPFGNGAGGSYIRNVPLASQIGINDGWASLTDGFVPLNFQPIASGGVPPFGQDMNGILKQSTSWDRWLSAGAPVTYDSTFQTAIAGYPAGTIVQSATTLGTFWFSTVDDNVTNPDTGGAGWTNLALLFAQNTPFYGFAALPAATFNVATGGALATTVTTFGTVTNGLKTSTFAAGILTIGTGDDGWYDIGTWLGTNLPTPGTGGTASTYGWTLSVGVSTDGGATYISVNGGSFISSTACFKGPFSGGSTPWKLNVGDKILCAIGHTAGVTVNAPCGLSAIFKGK
jgi:hypothetical protein